jgi:hypothetical protein
MVVLHLAYGLIIWGIVLFLRRGDVLPRARLLAGFIVAGVAGGLVAVWAWPADLAVLLDLPGVLLGDLVYNWSIAHLGDPSSSQAHFTIPWLLRVPQVYVLVSTLFWGFVGLIVQVVVNRKTR